MILFLLKEICVLYVCIYIVLETAPLILVCKYHLPLKGIRTVRENDRFQSCVKISFLPLMCPLLTRLGFPHSSVSKESACSAGHPGSVPGLGRSPGEGSGNPLQCSCLGNPKDRGAWWATGCKSRTRLSD